MFFNTINSYHIDLSYNNNTLIKTALTNKSFKFLDTLWLSKKVRNHLFKNDSEIYFYCKEHYDFYNAIKQNDVLYIQKVLSKDISKTILNEVYFKEIYFMLALRTNCSEITQLFLSKTNFGLTYSEFNIFEPLIINQYTETLITTLESRDWEFRYCTSDIIQALLEVDRSDYCLLFYKNTNFQEKLLNLKNIVPKGEELSINFRKKLKEKYIKNIQNF